jgi:hypothetical protein
MSDYLTRLIERSLGLGPQIEPLIAPLHAPSDQLLKERTESSTTPKTHPASVTLGDMTNGTATTPAQAGNASPEFLRMEQERSTVPTAAPTSPRQFSVEKLGEQDEPKRSRPTTPLQLASLPSDPEMPDPSLPAVTPAMLSAEQEPHIVAQPAATESFPAATASRGSGQSPSVSAPGSQTPARIFVQPQVSNRRQQPVSSPAFAREASSNEPPAIHVTIGRVEVRAIVTTPPPPRPSAPPAATPKISLEEYLEQRNRDRR